MSNPTRLSLARRGWLLLAAAGFASIFAASGAARAEEAASKDPKQVMSEAVDEVFKVLRDPDLKNDRKKRIGKLREVVDKTFDWETMAQSSLGPAWRKLDTQQRTEFVNVFKELLAQRYMDDIDRFQGTEQVQVLSSEKKAELAVVKTLLITASREKVPIDYTLHPASGHWMVEDLSIEGVSLVNHYRGTFSRFLVNNDFATLLKQLKHKLGLP